MNTKVQWFAGLSFCFAQYLQDHKGKCHQFTPEFYSFARRAYSFIERECWFHRIPRQGINDSIRVN